MRPMYGCAPVAAADRASFLLCCFIRVQAGVEEGGGCGDEGGEFVVRLRLRCCNNEYECMRLRLQDIEAGVAVMGIMD